MAVLLAAMIGGLATFAGSWRVSRSEHIRKQRVELFTGPLAEMTRYSDRRESGAFLDLRPVRDIAIQALTIPPDARHAARILDALDELNEAASSHHEPDEKGEYQYRPKTLEEQAAVDLARRHVAEAVFDLRDRLGRKLARGSFRLD